MLLDRRDFISSAFAGAAIGFFPAVPLALADEPALESRIKAIAFDALCIFDPRSAYRLAEKLFPGNGHDLGELWRTRQFEYTWLRVNMGRYEDFWKVTREALEFAAEKLKLELTQDKRDRLMNAFLELKPWPDVVPALTSLKESGIRLALLSNFAPNMLDANIKSAGLTSVFEVVLSTNQAKTYKPDPRAYQLGISALKLKRKEILFVAYGGWDAEGAKSFGYTTFWINRQDSPPERLGFEMVASGKDLGGLLAYMKSPQR
jgi:2-haloacid dehalogenase